MTKQELLEAADNVNKLDKEIAPGIWLDRNGNAHFSVPDILDHLGEPDTPLNRAVLTEALKEFIKMQNPQALITERSKPL